MHNTIEVILFDMGGTLRFTTPVSDEEKRIFLSEICELLGDDRSPEELDRTLIQRSREYKRWSEDTLIELNESELWTRWMLPEYPEAKISKNAVRLNQLFRNCIGKKSVFPETKEVVTELFRRGYRLGLVSNTTSSIEAPAEIESLRLTGYFETIVLSTVVGARKPDPEILQVAMRQMDVSPEKCVYVGDRVDRDVAVTRKAGLSKAIIMQDGRSAENQNSDDPSLEPDHLIHNLKELLDIFPSRTSPHPAAVYNASLSTMWGIENFQNLADFFEFARRTGFARIELNYRVDTAMLAGIDLSRFQFSSVHAPCPADITEEALKEKDYLISSVVEGNRRQGVQALKRSIDLAHQVGAPAIVIHAGHAPSNNKDENRLRAMVKAGLQATAEFSEIRQAMIEKRAAQIGPYFESVQKSMGELLAHAQGSNVCLGVEARYHYFEIPIPNELETLLAMAGPGEIGFIYDAGHVQTLDRLGFFPHTEWLERFSHRMIGMHLHDAVGTTDHMAAGLGELDFDLISTYLPENAFRTCEFKAFNSSQQVKAGLQYLARHGCVGKL